MKKIITKLLSILLIIPCLLLCACSSVKTITLSAYYETPEATIWSSSKTEKKNLSLDDLSSKKPVTTKMDAYLQLEMKAKSDFVYKLYIEKIEFYVYANQDATEMTLNLSITNMAKETDISNAAEFETYSSIAPKKNKSVKVTMPVERVIATATGSTLTLDILDSKNTTITDENGNATGFKWIIHGFKIYGEHRTYSK